MASVIYPSSLPCPATSTVTPAERRALSSADRPREARNIQRDRLEFERITWPAMDIPKADTILTFWRDTLQHGGAWFVADWPLPRGIHTQAVRKFREQPRWQFIPGGFWQLSALCEVRGRGEPPFAGYEIDLGGELNAGSSSAVGITLSGLSPSRTYTVSLPTEGRIFVAWTALPDNWRSDFKITTSGGTTTVGTFGLGFDSAEEARAAIAPFTITGYDTYIFWIQDSPVDDNGGGLSILVR